MSVTSGLLAEREFTRMCLELTEQQPFYMNRQIEQIFCRLSNGGVKFALDDFGTGYSVLSYLKHFPISYIKIDKSFAQNVLSEKTSRHIVESIIGLAEKMDIDSVAEGIESQKQVTCLKDLGVNYLQGYSFGRPEKLLSFCNQYNGRR